MKTTLFAMAIACSLSGHPTWMLFPLSALVYVVAKPHFHPLAVLGAMGAGAFVMAQSQLGEMAPMLPAIWLLLFTSALVRATLPRFFQWMRRGDL